MNMWCAMYGNYFQYIHQEYLKCLRNRLIKVSEPFNLSEIWKSNQKECDYNNLCAKKQGFYIGDCVTPDPYGIEFFDLLYIDPETDKVYVYHVKDGFNGNTRIASEQLLVSLNTKQAMLNLHEHYFEIYHESFIKANLIAKKKIPEKLETLDAFKKTLMNAIFVAAFRSNDKYKRTPDLTAENLRNQFFRPNPPKSLHFEALLKEKVSADDFIKPIEDNQFFKQLQRGFTNNGIPFNTVDEIATNIVEVLKQEKLINEKNKPTEQLIYYNDKFIKNKLMNYMNEASAKTVTLLLNQYRTQFSSFIAKLQVLRLEKQTEGRFSICDILCEAEPEEVKKLVKEKSQGKRELGMDANVEDETDAIKKMRKNVTE